MKIRRCKQDLKRIVMIGVIRGPNQLDQTYYLGVYIAHLREKLKTGSAQRTLIMTESAVGYRLIEKEWVVQDTRTNAS